MWGMPVLGSLGLRRAPVAMPSFAAATAFQRYVDLGRLVRSVLPLGNGRLMHSVVAYEFQGVDEDAEKLSLTAMCELAVVSRGLALYHC